MKKLLYVSVIAFLFASCKKESNEIANVVTTSNLNSVTTIHFFKTSEIDQPSFGEGPGPKYKWAPGTDVDDNPSTYTCAPTNDICFILGPIYYKGNNTLANDEIWVSFEKRNGKLIVHFDLEDISTDTYSKYLSGTSLILNTTKEFPEEIAKSLGLSFPYIINQGSYKFIEETATTKSVIL